MYIYHTLEGSNDIYGYGAKALGREISFLGRDENITKEDLIDFIKKHIDEGYPCIALEIIGPPEPCIITGWMTCRVSQMAEQMQHYILESLEKLMVVIKISVI